MSSYNHFGCSWCGGPFNGGNCWRCTNVSFGDKFVRNPDLISYDETPDFSYPPPQPQTYSCELYGNDSHYGYDCPPRVPLLYEQEPSYNQNFGDNYYPQNSPTFPQQYLCCTRCGGPHETFQCQQLIFYEPEPCYNQNFDDTFPQNSPNFQQQILCCENCGGPHESYQCQPMNQNYYDPNLCYNSNSSGFDQYQPPQYSVTHQPPQEKCMAELLLEEKLPQALQALCEKLNKYVQEKQEEKNIAEEQAAKVSSQYWKPHIYYDDDDDDEESSIPLRDIISELPLSVAFTPDLPIMDSLIMEDEHLDTIPETESDEENESSVEDLNLTPSESEDLSEDLSDIESECDMPVCDDFTTFSNPKFDSSDDFTSSDDESLSNENVPKENFKIYSNPLFDEEIISTKIDPHHFNAESDLIESLLNRDTS
ncbi:hypothetical protein Tco_0757782 [Tanacetum coccineum]